MDSCTNKGIEVNNAGIVILSSYIPIVFERLKLTSNGKFISDQAQADAIYYLQLIATGISNTNEIHLCLNKILCGLPLTSVTKNEIIDTQTTLIDGLLKAVISYWSAIGDCSIDGFRGNWLVRTGLLTEQMDRWELTVEKRAYDVLINQSPLAFSIIKFPWMDKPLHVNWPY